MKRVATKLGALCLGVVLLELCLQALALVGSLLREARYPEIAEAEHVVLCVGDSHVYGFNVDAAAAWPAQLEELLRAAELDACVVNRGLPGKHSRTVLEELPGYLADYQPDFVLCQVGINNRHSVIPPSGAAAPPAWRSLRSAQLISIFVNNGLKIFNSHQEGGHSTNPLNDLNSIPTHLDHDRLTGKLPLCHQLHLRSPT